MADLCAGRNELRGRCIRFAGAAVAPAEPGATRRSSQRDQPEHVDGAGGVGHRARSWRRGDCRGGRSVGVRRQCGVVPRRDRRAPGDARREPARTDADGARVDPSATPERLQRGRGARRAALRVSVAAHPIDDAARFLRDVLLVGHSAPADLRAGRPSRRSARIRLALLGAGRRRRARRRGDGASRRFDRTSRHRADCQHRDLWPRDDCVRPLHLILVDVWVSGRHRCRGHRERGVSQSDPAARNAGWPPRPDDRRQHGLLHRRPATRRVRGRTARAVGRPDRLCRERRHRLSRRNGVGRLGDAGAAMRTRRSAQPLVPVEDDRREAQSGQL